MWQCNVHGHLLALPKSGREDAGAPNALDLLLSLPAEPLGLDDDRLLGEHTLAQQLVVAVLDKVNDGSLARGVLLEPLTRLLRDQGPQLVHVQAGLPVVVLAQVVVAHAHLAKVARVVFVEVYPVVMLATGVTTASRMLAVLSDTAVTVAHVSS